MKNKVNSWRELATYKTAFELQQRIFEVSKSWPREESYSLTDQIRRSSRSIGANIAESWAKRRYPAHFKSKLTDAMGSCRKRCIGSIPQRPAATSRQRSVLTSKLSPRALVSSSAR